MAKTKKHRGIQKLGPRKYKVRVRGVDPRTGQMKEVKRIVETDLRGAQRVREELYAEIKTGIEEEQKERVTVATYARSWLEARLPRIKIGTAQHYATVLDLHILPAFGEIYFDSLMRLDIDKWISGQAERYQPESINGQLRVLKSLCRDAVEDLGIKNPTARVRALPKRDVEGDKCALTAKELRSLFDAVQNFAEKEYPLLVTLAFTGMRWGEATALKWSDIDKEEEIIRVFRAHRFGVVSTPKANKPRIYPLVPELVKVLQEHQSRLATENHPGLSEDWIFATRSKKDSNKPSLRTPSSWQKSLPKWLAAAGISKHITPHSFRRTNVDLLRQAKVDAVIARSLVGHATESMREHYSSVSHEEKREAISRVIELVGLSDQDGKSGT